MKNIFLLLALFAITATQAQTVRDFTLKTVTNENQSYTQLKGEKLTIIDFWASWCKPCLKGIPKIEQLYKNNKDKGVQVIGLNCDGPRSISKVSPLVRNLKITYPVLTDINNTLMQELEVSALPTLLIIDVNNKIVYRHEGFAKGDEYELQEVIDKLLKE